MGESPKGESGKEVPKKAVEEFDLLGLDIGDPQSKKDEGNKSTTDTISEESKEKKKLGEMELFTEAELQLQGHSKTAEKIIKRKKGEQKPSDGSKLSELDDKGSLTMGTPSKEGPLQGTDLHLEKTGSKSVGSNPQGSTGKKQHPIIVKKDSFSDEENKYVIG